MARRAQALGWEIPIAMANAETAAGLFAENLPVASLDLPITALPAHPDESSAPAAIAAIRRAVDDVIAGRAAAMVTNPVAKAVLYRAGFPDPGHTEYLGRLAKEKMSVSARPVMMIKLNRCRVLRWTKCSSFTGQANILTRRRIQARTN